MQTLLPIAQLAGLVGAFFLPGYLIARLADAPWSSAERALVAVVLGFVVVPMVCFCAACLVGASITPLLVVGCSLGISVAALGAGVLRDRLVAGGRANLDG